jgi:hypothetical protein
MYIYMYIQFIAIEEVIWLINKVLCFRPKTLVASEFTPTTVSKLYFGGLHNIINSGGHENING